MPALIFDCDGVLADTERYGHLPAFNQTFAEFGLPVHWSRGGLRAKLLDRRRQGADGAALLTPEFVAAAGLPTDPSGPGRAGRALAPAQDRASTPRWSPPATLPARPGIAPDRRRRPPTPAGSSPSRRRRPSRPCGPCSSTPSGPSWPRDFAVFAGDVVPRKKPAPDIYQLAVGELGAPTRPDASSSRTAATGCSPRSAPGCLRRHRRAATPRDEDFTGAALVVSAPRRPGRRAGRRCWPTRTTAADPRRPRRPRPTCERLHRPTTSKESR